MAQTAPAHGATKKFDPGVPIGLSVGIFMTIGAWILFEHGQISMLFGNPSPWMVVVGGTIATLMMAFPMHIVTKFPKYMGKAFFEEHEDPLVAVQTFVRLAEKARREGLLSLEDEAQNLESEFVREGIQEVVDGTPPEQIQELLEIRISEMEARHHEGMALFEAGGGFAPTMGIIGTVLGLMSTLGSLATAGTDQLGASIATAFIATFIGILSANLFWLPLAQRLRRRSHEEVQHRSMMVAGILAIQAGDAPRLVRTKLEGFLAPADKHRSQQAAQGGGLSAEPAGAR